MRRGTGVAVVPGLLAAVAALGLMWRPVPRTAAVMSNSERLALYDRLTAAEGTLEGVSAIHREEYLLRVHVSTVEARERVRQVIDRLGLPEWTVQVEEARRLTSTADPLAGCRTDLKPPPAAAPGSLGVSLALSSEVLHPGDAFTLTVTGWREEAITRSSVTFLECWTGEEWLPVYRLFPGGETHVYAEWLMVRDEGLRGAGPEALALPESLLTGWYRVRQDVLLEVGAGRGVSPVALLRVGR